ncbi:hypothetical protein QCD60_19825 [Pokkaliibacter sp. MBI-7]|uniref:hypothetical protein n=1 Tax=Pokkaliibacter sp. MBI-7 TaxID=3040600 RepID=UPI00244987F2|nr:hypothetical protein [Pokkaliibacter sp. MBI-7]MDH2434794.1 hypothetical protein [Pokkaliibacter sp. MBI-7]
MSQDNQPSALDVLDDNQPIIQQAPHQSSIAAESHRGGRAVSRSGNGLAVLALFSGVLALAVSGFGIYQNLQLGSSDRQQSAVINAQAQAVEKELNELRSYTTGLEQKLTALSSTSNGLVGLASRIDQLERSQGAGSAMTEELHKALAALGDRLGVAESSLTVMSARLDAQSAQVEANAAAAVQARQVTVATVASAKKPVTRTSKPRVLTPPFVVLGAEVRGGESFLAVAPSATSSLSQVVLLKVGSVYSGWKLQSLGDGRAVFNVSGRSQEVAL